MENGELYASYRYKQIIEEQVAISYASKGISIEDTDELTPFDRKLILDNILKIKDQEKQALEEARFNNKNNSPGIRKTSRYQRK